MSPEPPPKSTKLDPQRPAADPSDVNSIDAIIRAVYEAVSFTDSSGTDGPRLASLMTCDAKLLKVMPDLLSEGSVSDYVERVQAWIERSGCRGFVERELFRRTEVYGGIAHVFSSYEGRTLDSEGEVIERGINSFQLRHDGNRWWILSLLWTEEDDARPIPPAYLPRR
ncbi:MAG: hypothetical protein ACPG4T_23550 [Nannocystaceae bacterium]